MCFPASTDDMLYDPRSTSSASKARAGVIHGDVGRVRL